MLRLQGAGRRVQGTGAPSLQVQGLQGTVPQSHPVQEVHGTAPPSHLIRGAQVTAPPSNPVQGLQGTGPQSHPVQGLQGTGQAPQNNNLSNNSSSSNRGNGTNNNIRLSQVEKLKRNRNKQYVRNCRLRKKTKSLQNALDQCKKKMSDETFLEVSEQAQSMPDHLLSVYHQNTKTGKHQYRYDDKIRKFALSLHLKSPSAYRYVRRVFGKALPSSSTIQRWCFKVDMSPGFNDLSFRYLKTKVEEYEANGKKLLLSLAIDEMAIRKGWNVVGKETVGGVDYGTGTQSDQLATHALVLMGVSINNNFKLPLAHFYTSTINGQGKINNDQQH